MMPDSYDDFIYAYNEYCFGTKTSKIILKEDNNRKDYCHKCKNEGYWVMMALKCKSCNKILLGGD